MGSKNIIHKDHGYRADPWCRCENSKNYPCYDIHSTCIYCGAQKQGILIPDSTMSAIKNEQHIRELMETK
jgi:hypothetical protein